MNVKFLQFPTKVEEVANSNNNLRMALNRLRNGTPDTPRTWFYEDKDPIWILNQVQIQLRGMSKDLQNISDWDLSKSDKFVPQGGSAPLDQRLEGFNEYFSHLSAPKIIDDPIWKKAKLEAIRRLRFNESGSPAALKDVVNRGLSEDKYNTNSGWELYTKRKNPEAIKFALDNAGNAIDDHFPCTLGTRATMGKRGKDARNIFMASMPVNVEGQRFQQPLQDYLRSLNDDFFLPWEGWEHVQQNISKRWTDTNLKFGADYTKMDQHFNKYHGSEVFDVIKHYFKREYWTELDKTIQYVFQVPIITNLGYVDQEHAMPSGSEWTNFLETLWNYIFCIYLELKYHLKFISKMGIGDDQLWFLDGKWDSKAIKWIITIVMNEFEAAGLPGNPAKQEVSLSETGFLQRHMSSNWNGLDGTVRAAGVYPIIRNVTSEVYPERFHMDKEDVVQDGRKRKKLIWDADMFALRCIMIAENCIHHPVFKWYVQEFLAHANRAILDFARKSDDEIRKSREKAKKIANFMPSYNQEKENEDICKFKTLALLREVA